VFRIIVRALLVAFTFTLASCATKDRDHVMRVSVPDQKMILFRKGVEVARFDVSTSKFGLGDRPGSNATPLGTMEVARKIGGGARSGMKFKSRRATGEVVAVNAPGRDPIVTRILWLRGMEAQNRRTFSRLIYIHGTPEEARIGTPASYGCIRMRSRDVIALFDTVGVGARVEVSTAPFPRQLAADPATITPPAPATAAPAPAVTASTATVKRG
jgi:L,D-transpeptidase catalytic domain